MQFWVAGNTKLVEIIARKFYFSTATLRASLFYTVESTHGMYSFVLVVSNLLNIDASKFQGRKFYLYLVSATDTYTC